MGSVISTPAVYNVTCDLCGHAQNDSATAVPENWGIVGGPNVMPGPPTARRVLLCPGCLTGYKHFWKLDA